MSIADAGVVNGRVVGCCFVAEVAGCRRGRAVRGDGHGPAPLRHLRSWLRTLGCFLVVLSPVLSVLFAVACCRGVHRRGGPLAVALLHGSLVLDMFAYVGVFMFVLVSSAERFAWN